MKNRFLYKICNGFLLLGLALAFASCDDVNDWGVDESQNGTFSPVVFESEPAATNASLIFSKVTNAKSYVFELSQDSLEFNTITRTIEVEAEDLVRDTLNLKERYLILIKHLDAETRYSARLKVTSSVGLPDSKWVTTTFKTKAEQIFEATRDLSDNGAILTWSVENPVTHIILSTEGAADQRLELTSEEIAKGEKVLTGLTQLTEYKAVIYDQEIKRGTTTFATMAKVSGDGTKYYLKGGEDLVAYLNAIKDEAVVLVFPGGSSYTIGSDDGNWAIPAHIKSLTLWGLPSGDNKVALDFKSIKLDKEAPTFKLWVYNMNISGRDAGNDYILNDDATRSIPELKLENSIANTFRALFRFRNKISVGNVEILNSVVSNLGNFGVVNVDAITSFNSVVIENSTVYNLTGSSILTFKVKPNVVQISNCTFYDAPASEKYVVTFDGKAANMAASMKIANSIFAASKAEYKLSATNPQITTDFVRDSYKTTELVVNTKYPLTGISDYSKTSADLFVDPANGDFTIKDTNIGGESKPGDPRWWK